MFFNEIEQIPHIAAKTSCSVFAIDPAADFKFPRSTYITPLEGKTTISVDQIRELIRLAQKRRTTDHFFVLAPAEAITEVAANALLKTIEQPPAHCHFVLLTKTPSALMPTILSRSQVYYLYKPVVFTDPPEATKRVQDLAKQLLVATPRQLPELADTIAKHRPDNRAFALQVVSTAIEMLYKTFFITNQPKWLKKLPQFITLYDNLSQNGHVKLHLVADLC